jgi:hypothetical protein
MDELLSIGADVMVSPVDGFGHDRESAWKLALNESIILPAESKLLGGFTLGFQSIYIFLGDGPNGKAFIYE